MTLSPTLVQVSNNGTSDEIKLTAQDRVFGFQGTFEGGTLTIEVSYDDGVNWVTLTKDTTGALFEITDEGVYTINAGHCKMRFVLTGAVDGSDSDSDAGSINIYIS